MVVVHGPGGIDSFSQISRLAAPQAAEGAINCEKSTAIQPRTGRDECPGQVAKRFGGNCCVGGSMRAINNAEDVFSEKFRLI